MQDPLFEDISDVPNALRRGWEAGWMRDLARDRLDVVHITGSGDSLFAARALRGPLAEHGVAVAPEYPFALARQRALSAQDVLIAVSFSGTSKRTVEAAVRAAGAGSQVIAFTANPDSPLSATAHGTIRIPWESHSRKLPHCADHIVALAALAATIEARSGSGAELGLLADLDARFARAKQVGRQLAEDVADAEWIYFLAPGDAVPVAEYAAAKLWELSGQRALAFELEEFGHGPHMMVTDRDAVVFVATQQAAADVQQSAAAWAGEAGATIVALEPSPYEGLSRLFDDHFPLQWLVYWLKEQRHLRAVSEGERLQA